MALQVLINLLIGVLWMLLHDEWSSLSFTTGYLLGMFVLFILRRFLPNKYYVQTLGAVVQLVLIFLYELFVSSFLVFRIIVSPNLENITPGIFSFQTTLESDMEITLLSMLITLTPGSVVMDVSPDRNIIYVHAMDMPELSEAVMASMDRFENAIKRVTRDD